MFSLISSAVLAHLIYGSAAIYLQLPNGFSSQTVTTSPPERDPSLAAVRNEVAESSTQSLSHMIDAVPFVYDLIGTIPLYFKEFCVRLGVSVADHGGVAHLVALDGSTAKHFCRLYLHQPRCALKIYCAFAACYVLLSPAFIAVRRLPLHECITLCSSVAV